MGINYSVAGMKLEDLKATGRATCEGGQQPRVPLHHYPLLCWMHAGHPEHGMDVFTEDQKAGVPQIAAAVAECPSFAALAERFGTTVDHVTQALDYALEAGCLA